ncbi:DEAD/DEAH box helicase [Aspergillus glaucus CBS 516.65]|uniref:Helicase ATP-binding domain-containing protein n=1 Tax=Aspergillus glaucus CBS 516.65 TaxID=1160497 RepID=A0A1L9VA80_ASPGL|nr:hypothetical protein ASPGLDRAFT_134190 [Aspergillus glaucus CBS 516.65]OJJ80742.1 hypothetical protein ASPGLDRAFT_134190 [Aspergillus glaucus CBS 516.65]
MPVSTPLLWARAPPQRKLWRPKSTLAIPLHRSTEPEQPSIVLRDYQEECIQSVLRYVDEGHKRLGISLATGAGKTVIFTQLIGRIPPRNEYGDKTLVIVHRRELVEQAAHHCRLAYPDKTVEVEMGNSHYKGHADICVASIRSLMSGDRIEKFFPGRFKLILVDEAHHIVAKSYREVLGYFGLNEPTEDSPVLVGVSATFSRPDGLKLGAAIDHIVYHKDYMDMIDERWLANAVFTTVRSDANLSRVKRDKSGDFQLGSLSQAVNTDSTNNITVRAWLANAHDRKSTLVFCVDIDHTKTLTETFRQYGIDARYITSGTSKEVRAEQLRAFRNQEYPVLVNCGLFTEGTDIPNIDCVLLARPTRSRNLLIQMIGRGLRLFPGKENCHIIDMVATLETGVLSTPTLFGLHPDEVLEKSTVKQLRETKEEQLARIDREAREEERRENDTQSPLGGEKETSLNEDINIKFTRYDSITDLLGDMRSDKHIRSLSQHAWVRAGDDRYVLSGLNGWVTIEKGNPDTHAEGRPKSRHTKTTPSIPESDELYTVHHVTKFQGAAGEHHYSRPRLIAQAPNLEYAVDSADTFAASTFPKRYISARQPWRNAPATPSQLDMLNRANLKSGRRLQSEHMTRGQATDMITKLKFGGKKRFNAMMKQRLKNEEKVKEVREMRRTGMGVGDVRVGPVVT